MKLQPLQSRDYRILQELFCNYQSTFPKDEQRCRTDFFELIHRKNCQILSIQSGQKMIGYFVIWQLSNFVFLECFEIYEQYRGKSFGSKAMQVLLQLYPKMLLEIEPDKNSVQKKRRVFYEKFGFRVLTQNYVQPKYSSDKKDVPLYLLKHLVEGDEQLMIREIHRVVYEKYETH